MSSGGGLLASREGRSIGRGSGRHRAHVVPGMSDKSRSGQDMDTATATEVPKTALQSTQPPNKVPWDRDSGAAANDMVELPAASVATLTPAVPEAAAQLIAPATIEQPAPVAPSRPSADLVPALLKYERREHAAGSGQMYSIHGEQAARRRAVGELIFFAGTNDLRRCKQIASVWNIKVKDPSVLDYDRRTPLHVAAAEGAYSVVHWLVYEEGAPINPVDRHHKTPLEEAARNDHTEVVKLLVEKGGCVVEDDKLVALEKSKMHGIVNNRRMIMQELGWDPEWEVNPKELVLLDKIGNGEFGDVYRAKWHGSFVAAKLLKRSDEIALGDFRTEIAILRKIHHPNTTQFLGACTKQKPYIVITELMACSLTDAFSRTFFVPSVRRQVEIALDFARGMAYLHSRRQPVVHRDLKPANLMISGNLHADTEQLYLDSGVIKVCDFGLSKSLVPVDKHGQLMTLDMDTTYKLTGETGSYRYMAPEVFRHEPYNLKVDVYSFAMIVFQLFECTVPFAGQDPLEAARAAAMLGHRPEFPPRNKISTHSQALRDLVCRCWDGEPEKRPSFEDIVIELEKMLKELPKHQYFKPGQHPDDCCTIS